MWQVQSRSDDEKIFQLQVTTETEVENWRMGTKRQTEVVDVQNALKRVHDLSC